jgi:hypothetical protein
MAVNAMGRNRSCRGLFCDTIPAIFLLLGNTCYDKNRKNKNVINTCTGKGKVVPVHNQLSTTP